MSWMKIFSAYLATFICCIGLLLTCIEADKPYTKIPPGKWRGILKIDNIPINKEFREPTLETIGELQMESILEGELPFNFNVIYVTEDSFYVELINGSEKIKVTDINYGIDRSTTYDTLFIDFPVYDTYIKVNVAGPIMQGHWVVNYRGDKPGDYTIPFTAHHGKEYRFQSLKKTPTSDLTGNWTMKFLDKTPYKGVAELKQNGEQIIGTIRTETGDYRYLEGIVQDDKMFMSVFDGSHAFLFESKILSDDEMIGTFASGKHFKIGWKAQKSNDDILENAFELTYTEKKDETFVLDLPNINGGRINITDNKYKDKIKLIKIMGTWCPNCRDEAVFLKGYLDTQASDDIAVIAVGFEKYRDSERNIQLLSRYKEKMNIPYEIAYGGNSSKKESSKVFPQLNKIISYPTLIFLDKNNRVHKIHTGFNGPATSKFEEFKKEFQSTIDDLRKI